MMGRKGSPLVAYINNNYNTHIIGIFNYAHLASIFLLELQLRYSGHAKEVVVLNKIWCAP